MYFPKVAPTDLEAISTVKSVLPRVTQPEVVKLVSLVMVAFSQLSICLIVTSYLSALPKCWALMFRENNIKINKNKILTNHKVSIMSFHKGNFNKEIYRTNGNGHLELVLTNDTKYLIESVVIIEGSNKKKDNYAKWHSLWTSYTLKTPNK